MARSFAVSILPIVFTLIAGAAHGQQTAPEPQPAAQAAPIPLQSPIPFDAAVKTGTLANGLKYYVRRNSRPANRVL